jgi:heat shock protein HslJ
MRKLSTCLLLAGLLAGCKAKSDAPPPPADGANPPPPAADQSPAGITGRDWVLISLGDNAAPLGNGGKPVTLRLDSAENRASGNAGCNRYSGPFHLLGDSLSFGPAISTKMACEQGMDVEIGYLGMLPRVMTYRVDQAILELRDAESKTLARFQSQ